MRGVLAADAQGWLPKRCRDPRCSPRGNPAPSLDSFREKQSSGAVRGQRPTAHRAEGLKPSFPVYHRHGAVHPGPTWAYTRNTRCHCHAGLNPL